MNIVVGTLTLWGLVAFLVQPLSNHWLRRHVRKSKYVHLSSIDELDETEKQELASAATKYFILASILVLSISGFVLGVAFGPFIGFSWKWKFWPGMIALIVASFAGAVFIA